MKKLHNILLIFVGLYALYTIIPRIMSNFSQEGKVISAKEYEVLNRSDSRITFPGKKNTIAIFWATWCAPCKLEMGRLKSSVEEGKIPEGAIIAINPFEPVEIVREFLKSSSYPFTFIHAPEVIRELNVTATPTTAFIENGKLMSLATGLSIIGIWKAENFL